MGGVGGVIPMKKHLSPISFGASLKGKNVSHKENPSKRNENQFWNGFIIKGS